MCSQQSKGAKYPQKSFNCADAFSIKITRFHAALKPIFRNLKPFQAFSSLLNLGARVFSFYMNTYSDGFLFVWKTGVEKNLAKLKEKAKVVFNECGGKSNLTRKKLRELADKQLPPNAEFVHGIGKRKSEWQKRYETLDSLWTKWTEYEDKLFAIGNNRRSMSKTDKDATFMRMKEDHMGNGQLKPAYNVQLAVNSEYITGVAAFSNRTDSGTLIPFLNHIQRMQSKSYRDIVADAGYESVRNYLYLEQHGQNCFIKPISYENQKTKKFKSQFWRVENMEPLEHEDGFLCAGGRKILFARSSSKKENGFVTARSSPKEPITTRALPIG